MPARFALRLLPLLLVWPMGSLAHAQDDAAALLEQSRAAQRHVSDILKEYAAANGELQQQLQILKPMEQYLRQPAPTASQVEMMKKQVEQMQLRIAILQEQLKLADLTDPTARTAKAEQFKQKIEAVSQQAREALKPYEARVIEYAEQFKEPQHQLATLLGATCKVPKQPYPPATQAQVTAIFHTGSVVFVWTDTDKKNLAALRLQLAPRPELPAELPRIDGSLIVTASGPDNLNGFIGAFQAYFVVMHEGWKGQDQIGKLLSTLVDLPAIAKVGQPARPGN